MIIFITEGKTINVSHAADSLSSTLKKTSIPEEEKAKIGQALLEQAWLERVSFRRYISNF
jgi:hypothetical protein